MTPTLQTALGTQATTADGQRSWRALPGLRARHVLLYGLLIWVVPFVVAMLIYPIRENDRPLFESIMPVVVVAVTVFSGVRTLRASPAVTFGGAVVLGVAWMAISVAIDLVLFIFGPIQMSLLDYVKDIGLTYLVIPLVAGGIAAVKANTG